MPGQEDIEVTCELIKGLYMKDFLYFKNEFVCFF
jgi:hypothetical protein